MSDHQRRERYSGTHPKRFTEKYKELAPERYAADVEKVKGRGQTPAGTHRPICLEEILEILHPAPGETGLDATLGYGGHAQALWQRVLPGGVLVATEIDSLELPKTEARLRSLGHPDESLIVRHQNFSGLERLLPLTGAFDFVLADLGVSSMQIDNPDRGFTFKAPGPLDLRLNPKWGKPAWALLEGLTRRGLETLLTDNADEPHAAAIAKALTAHPGRIKTTTDLAEAISQVLAGFQKDDPEEETKKTLQRCFQALRIAVNREFDSLDTFLAVLPKCLKSNARVAVLTFHSGEEKRVVRAFDEGRLSGIYSSVSSQPIRASTQERYDNPRSKSARLHWAVRASQR